MCVCVYVVYVYASVQEDAALHDDHGMSRWPWVRHMLQMAASYIFGAFL